MTKFTDDQIALLNAPLDKSKVATRKQAGMNLSYIEGWHAIAEANRIFGFDAWNRETISMQEVRCDEVGDKWRVAFIAKVRVTVGDVIRDGTGYGSGISKDLGDAYESAVKEAETDAMKRAFMMFGNPFGLALYDKTQANVAETPTKTRSQKLLEQRAVGKRFDSLSDSARVLEAHKAALLLATSRAELAQFAKENEREITHLMDDHWIQFIDAFNGRKNVLPEGIQMEDAA